MKIEDLEAGDKFKFNFILSSVYKNKISEFIQLEEYNNGWIRIHFKQNEDEVISMFLKNCTDNPLIEILEIK